MNSSSHTNDPLNATYSRISRASEVWGRLNPHLSFGTENSSNLIQIQQQQKSQMTSNRVKLRLSRQTVLFSALTIKINKLNFWSENERKTNHMVFRLPFLTSFTLLLSFDI